MVKAWREDVVIPTYEVGMPDKNPMYLEKRVYQGSSGVVYPYPVIEKIADEPTDHTWHAVYIENEYIKVMVLPELGGRIQMAYDKIKQRHFVYYNHVIKPALVGLAGPWISGGIEFNWPQHHRPSTYLPVDCDIVDNSDGSVTVWVNETERMFHQNGRAGFTLRPGCAYLEIKGRLYNGTNVPQTFLWWANPAVAVNDDYQSVFPQDVNAVFDHGKRAVSSFPIATGTYYKMDYSAGVDISNYRNIKVPTSYMAVNSKFDFEGGYENDTHAGMLHVASHHVSPGKKQWTWGNGDFGRAWDRNLTDADGPYIELMAGVFTENQPDFSWLMPYEEKHFTQYFMPYRELGVVKNATRDLIFNIVPTAEGKARLMLFATSCRQVKVCLTADDGTAIYNKVAEVSPEDMLDVEVDLQGWTTDQLHFSAQSETGRELLSWHAEADEIRPIPDAAEAALRPEEIKTNEQLYLTGLHLEQYRHATYNPADYYNEALRRDPDDYRCNNAMGLLCLRRYDFVKAEAYFRHAVKTVMRRNPNPYDGEPLYNLALALKYEGHDDEAYKWFYKATWNAAWQDAAFYHCAAISASQGRWEDALEEIDASLSRNTCNHKAWALKVTVLRHLARKSDAMVYAKAALQINDFNYGCLFELYLLTGEEKHRERMATLMHGSPYNYDELALDYMTAGLSDEALQVWQLAIAQGAVTPMTYYYRGWAGDTAAFDTAEQQSPDYCFPNAPEAALALRLAMTHNERYARAPYYLGCMLYAKRDHISAMYAWKTAADNDPAFPTVWRNLGLHYYNKAHDPQRALECMERAFRLDESDARILMELDQLRRRLGHPHEDRLNALLRHEPLIAQRDDLMLEKATLLNLTGQYEEAMQLIDGHKFHPWEGGEGKVVAQYQLCRVELAKLALHAKDYDRAIRLLEQCLVYPENLGEGKLHGAQENDIHYLLGEAYAAMGDTAKANRYWELATGGPQQPVAAMYYNDAKPDKIFYQGMALRRLNREDEARGRFNKLLTYGKQHLFDHVRMDYFAVSLPDLQIWEGSLDEANKVHCNYMLALGYYGLGDTRHATRYLDEAAAMDRSHIGIFSLKTFMQYEA